LVSGFKGCISQHANILFYFDRQPETHLSTSKKHRLFRLLVRKIDVQGLL